MNGENEETLSLLIDEMQLIGGRQSMFGCMSNYISTLDVKKRFYLEMRKKQRKTKAKAPKVKARQIKKLICCVLKGLNVDSKTAKTVTIQALILIERLIDSSQSFDCSSFAGSTHEDIFGILQSLVEDADGKYSGLASHQALLRLRLTDLYGLATVLKDEKPNRPLFQLTSQNWRPVVFTSLILSLKYQDDWNLQNVVIWNLLKIFDTKQMHNWMNTFCVLLDYRFNVTDIEINKYQKSLVIYDQL